MAIQFIVLVHLKCVHEYKFLLFISFCVLAIWWTGSKSCDCKGHFWRPCLEGILSLEEVLEIGWKTLRKGDFKTAGYATVTNGQDVSQLKHLLPGSQELSDKCECEEAALNFCVGSWKTSYSIWILMGLLQRLVKVLPLKKSRIVIVGGVRKEKIFKAGDIRKACVFCFKNFLIAAEGRANWGQVMIQD